MTISEAGSSKVELARLLVETGLLSQVHTLRIPAHLESTAAGYDLGGRWSRIRESFAPLVGGRLTVVTDLVLTELIQSFSPHTIRTSALTLVLRLIHLAGVVEEVGIVTLLIGRGVVADDVATALGTTGRLGWRRRSGPRRRPRLRWGPSRRWKWRLSPRRSVGRCGPGGRSGTGWCLRPCSRGRPRYGRGLGVRRLRSVGPSGRWNLGRRDGLRGRHGPRRRIRWCSRPRRGTSRRWIW